MATRLSANSTQPSVKFLPVYARVCVLVCTCVCVKLSVCVCVCVCVCVACRLPVLSMKTCPRVALTQPHQFLLLVPPSQVKQTKVRPIDHSPERCTHLCCLLCASEAYAPEGLREHSKPAGSPHALTGAALTSWASCAGVFCRYGGCTGCQRGCWGERGW